MVNVRPGRTLCVLLFYILVLVLLFNLPSSLIPDTGRVVTPMGNVGVKHVGDCRPTPVDPVTKSSVGVFCLFFKFGVGLESKTKKR